MSARTPKQELEYIIKRTADVYDKLASTADTPNTTLASVHSAILNLRAATGELEDGEGRT